MELRQPGGTEVRPKHTPQARENHWILAKAVDLAVLEGLEAAGVESKRAISRNAVMALDFWP